MKYFRATLVIIILLSLPKSVQPFGLGNSFTEAVCKDSTGNNIGISGKVLIDKKKFSKKYLDALFQQYIHLQKDKNAVFGLIVFINIKGYKKQNLCGMFNEVVDFNLGTNQKDTEKIQRRELRISPVAIFRAVKPELAINSKTRYFYTWRPKPSGLHEERVLLFSE